MKTQLRESTLIFEQTDSPVVDRRVALIQRFLHLLQFPTVVVDGLFGEKTAEAVKKYQKNAKLQETGAVDEDTGRSMNLPFWQSSTSRSLDVPYRDKDVYDNKHQFTFRSSVGLGYFYSSWPDAAYESKNALTWRALRTNNPGAINISNWQMNLAGYIGKTHADSQGNQTTIYETPEYGVAAWVVLLRIVYFKGSKEKVTVGDIIDKYRGGNPRSDYLEGYKRFSNGELTEDFELDLYDSAQLCKVAVASYSHEFGSWYPLMDEQLLAGIALADAYFPAAAEPLIKISPRELDSTIYQTTLALQTESEEPDEQKFGEDFDSINSHLDRSARLLTRPPRLSFSDARWPAKFQDSPDMWHLEGDFVEKTFELTLPAIKNILRVGSFEPNVSTNGRLVLALRGCMLASDQPSEQDCDTIELRATNPDHENFRCCIGVVDLESGKLSLFQASTVPRRTGMLRFYNKVNFGEPAANCNLLPTGCYQYCVGTHHGHLGAVAYVLRLGTGPDVGSAGKALVLRTTDDLIYETQDIWDSTKPGDNIHPAFLPVSFSSVGCLTVHGYQKPNGDYSTATDQWKAFREKLGFDGKLEGMRFDAVMVTGHEAAAIASVSSDDQLETMQCLRQGSIGERVSNLRRQIGLAEGQVFDTETAQALTEKQNEKLGFATATWNKKMAALLGMNF